MTYDELRSILPIVAHLRTLGGKMPLKVLNPPAGDLQAVNSKGNIYRISREDWVNANVIRSRNPRNPWSTSLYTCLGEGFSYGLIHAAAILRHLHLAGTAGTLHSPNASGALATNFHS